MQGFIQRFFGISATRFLFVAFLLALIQSLVLAVTIGYARGIGTDGAFYSLSGYHLFRGMGFTYSDVPNTFTWPMLSVLAGALSLVIDDLQVCMHIVLTLAYALGVVPFYGMVRNLADERTARIGTVLYVCNGFLLRMSARMTAEGLLIFWLILAAYFVSVVIRDLRSGAGPSWRHFAGAGLGLGLAYLTKPEGAVFMMSTTIFLAITLWRRRVFQSHLVPLAIFLVTFIVTISPQVVFIHEATGKWQLTTYNRFFFRGVIEPFWSLSPGVAATDPKAEYNYNAYIVREPYTGDSLERDLDRLPKHLSAFLSRLWVIVGPMGLLFFLASLLVKRATHSSRSFAFAFLSPITIYWLWYNPAERLMMVFVPFLILLALEMVLALRDRWVEKRWAVPILATALFAFALTSFQPISHNSPTNAVIGNHALMGRWIRENLPEMSGKLLADRKPYVAFMARTRYYRYNNMPDVQTLLQKLHAAGVDYLMVDDYYTRQKNPGVIELLQGTDTPDLKFIHRVEDTVWGAAILYQLRKDVAP